MENGISNDLMFKALLRKFTKKASIANPVYQTFTEDTPHGTHYRTHVWVDGICFKSPYTFLNKKMAEHDAARHVLVDFLEKVKSDKPVGILEDTTFCKSIVKEYALKMNIRQKSSLNMKLNSWKPTYTTKSTKALIPMFISSLELNGATYVGQPAKNKKEAEKLVARSAILSILDSKSKATMSKIVKSKFKFYISLKKIKDLSCFQALTMDVASDTVDPSEHSDAFLSVVDTNNEAHGVDGAAVAEIPQPSPLVPSVHVLDVNPNGPLESSVKGAPDTTFQAQPTCNLTCTLPVDMIAQRPAPVSMIDSGAPLLVTDKSNEAYAVDEGVVAEYLRPTPLVPSVQVPDANQSCPLEHKLKGSTLEITPTELAVPCIEFVPPASEPAPAGKKRNRKKMKGQLRQPLPMISQSPHNVSMTDSGALLSGVDEAAVAEIPQDTFFNNGMSEHDAAGHVFIDFLEKVKSDKPVGIFQDTTFCKSILNQYAMKMKNMRQKMNLNVELNTWKPTYTTKSAESLTPMFYSSVELNGATYVGQPAKTKKEAENLVARSAILSILDSKSNTAMSKIVESKIKFYESSKKVSDLTYFQASTTNVVSGAVDPSEHSDGLLSVVDTNNKAHGVDGAVVFEIPQLSPFVPSTKVPDVNQNGPLESAVKSAAHTPTELIVPRIEFIPPASEQDLTFGKKEGRLHPSSLPVAMASQSPAAMIDSGALLLAIDKSNEAHAVDGTVVAEIPHLSPLLSSGQVPYVNQNCPLEHELKGSTLGNTPTELVVPCIEFVPPASEPAPAGKKRNRKKKKGQLCQPPPMISQSPHNVSMSDSGALLSGVDEAAVAEIPQDAFLNNGMSEHDASGHVLIDFLEKVKCDIPVGIFKYTFCKSILNEYAVKMKIMGQKMNLNTLWKPTYSTKSAESLIPMFYSSLELNGATYVGQPAKTKREAENLAARSAILSILDSKSNTTMSEIVKSKIKFYEPSKKVNDLTYFQASTTNVVSVEVDPSEHSDGGLLSVVDTNNKAHSVDGATVAEIPQLSSFVPSVQVSDVNQNGPLESTVKKAPDTTSQVQPECSHVLKKRKLKRSKLAIAPPAESVVPCVGFVPPASEPALSSGKKKNRKKKKGKLHQPLLPVDMVAQSPVPVAKIDSGAHLSVTDKSNEDNAVVGSVVTEISQPTPLVPSDQALDVIQNGPMEYAVKPDAHTPTESVVPRIEFVPPSEPALASGKKRNRKRKRGQLHQPLLPVDMVAQSPVPVAKIDSGAHLSVTDKSNEAHVVGGDADVNQNAPLESTVKKAPDTTFQTQPECSHVFKKRKLKRSKLAIAPPAESVVPCVGFVPPASEPALASGKKRNRKKKKGKLHQPLLPVDMTSQSPASVDMINSGALLSIIDTSTEARAVDGGVVAEILHPIPLILEVNQNGPVEYAVKSAAHTASEAQPELNVLTSSIAPSKELEAPHIEFMPPTSEQSPASGERKGQLYQSPLPVGMTSQSPTPVDMIDNCALLSVIDTSTEAHAPSKELEATHIEFVPPASEQNPASGEREGQLHQSPLPAVIAQSSDPAYSMAQ